MKIDKHISELLFEHDCVIIPGFGGFVCNYSPASIHAGKNRFSPPFKKISFNRNLKNNDGLLANHISQADGVSYSEANRLIAECMEILNRELTTGKQFELTNIGTLYLGDENTILFEQDETVNYLPESFGLSAFHAPAIKRETIERKIERKLKDKIIVPSKEKKTEVPQKRTSLPRYMAMAASVIVIFATVIVSLKTDLLKNTALANLNPFAEEIAALYQPGPEPDPDTDVAKDNVRDLIASNGRNDTMRYLNIMINGNIPIVVSLQDDKKAVVKPNISRHKSKGRFNIIGGAFSLSENADKFLAKLKALGYDARIIDKKLYMVSYGSFSTREEALEAMEKIRILQNDVWLMTN